MAIPEWGCSPPVKDGPCVRADPVIDRAPSSARRSTTAGRRSWLRRELRVGQSGIDIAARVMRPEGSDRDMDRSANRAKLKLNGVFAQLLDAAYTASAAVAHECRCLAMPFRIHPVDGILEHCGRAIVIFRRDEDKAVGARDFGGPCLNDFVRESRPGVARVMDWSKKGIGKSRRSSSHTVRGLERDGLVTRTQFPAIPPRVDYELTDLGRSLWSAVEPLGAWAQGHVAHIIKACTEFDEKVTL